MKKLFFLVVCALALVLTLSACLDGGDGVTYDISDDGTYATVVGYVGTDTKVEIADTYEGVPVVEIYEGAFQYKKIIKEVKIPDSVTSIGSSAFYQCSSLTSVVIGDSVTSIGDSAFFWCDNLTSVEIGNSVTSIGDYAFYNCYNLTSVEIPDSVTNIGDSAFYGCTGLTDVYYTGTAEQWQQISIGHSNSSLTSATIHYNYVPEN